MPRVLRVPVHACSRRAVRRRARVHVPLVPAVRLKAAPRSTIRHRLADDRGSAIAEFVLVSALLTLIFASVLQFAFALHVRNTATDAAMAGARQASLADQTSSDGVNLTRALVTSGLGSSYAQDIRATRDEAQGLAIVTVHTPMPVLGLLGPHVWEMSARAPLERLDP